MAKLQTTAHTEAVVQVFASIRNPEEAAAASADKKLRHRNSVSRGASHR